MKYEMFYKNKILPHNQLIGLNLILLSYILTFLMFLDLVTLNERVNSYSFFFMRDRNGYFYYNNFIFFIIFYSIIILTFVNGFKLVTLNGFLNNNIFNIKNRITFKIAYLLLIGFLSVNLLNSIFVYQQRDIIFFYITIIIYITLIESLLLFWYLIFRSKNKSELLTSLIASIFTLFVTIAILFLLFVAATFSVDYIIFLL